VFNHHQMSGQKCPSARNILTVMLIPSLLSATSIYGQESEQVINEIVVSFIRKSSLDAIDIKRNNTGVMEAISAEDFGRFPDGNLAESLARVPGIAIDRSNVEGQAIAVRGFGPEFNLVTLNGRQMPTTPGQYGGGRSFNFGDIASPGISAVEVFKAGNLSLPSGGIGSTVNMVTTRPLNIDGTLRSFSIAGVEDTTSKAGGLPVEGAMLFATNRGRWGFSISGAYQERTNQEQGTRESNWIVPEVMALSEGYSRVDPTAPGITDQRSSQDGYTFYQEPSAYLIKDNDRVRKNLQITLQGRVTDNLIATLDYTHSGVEFNSEGMLFGSWLGGWTTQQATINQRGVYTDVVVGERSYDHTATWGSLKSSNNSIGINLAWDVTDTLTLELDAHDSKAALGGNIFDNSIGATSDVITNVRSTNGGSDGIYTFAYDRDSGAENMYLTNLNLQDDTQLNQITQYQLKAEWRPEFALLTSVEAGISISENRFNRIRRQGTFAPTAQGRWGASDFDDGLFSYTPLVAFMNSFGSPADSSYYFDIDPASAFAAIQGLGGNLVDNSDQVSCCTAGGIDSNERVVEDLESAFLQFNLSTEAFGYMPLNVQAGLRYESVETQSTSLYPLVNRIDWNIDGLYGVRGDEIDASRFGSNSQVLPSIALSLGVTENQILRASWGRSIARPNLGDLESQLAIGSQDFFNLTATGGNPDLNPLRSTNFDLAYENYYAEGSYISINYFRKEIEDFVGNQTVNDQPFNGLTNPASSEIGLKAQACVQEWVAAGRPQTGFPGEGGTGDCVSQQFQWAQGWAIDQHHMFQVASALEAGVDVLNGAAYLDAGWNPACPAGHWWVCGDGNIEGSSSDPLALFDITQPVNLESGRVSGFEGAWQHFFEDTPYGFTVNYTKVSGGNVEPDLTEVGRQFTLAGFGDSGNASVFFENPRHTLRLALNYRAETASGFANYEQPVFVEERKQIDFSYQYRYSEKTTFFLDAQNITDEETRLFVRYPEMLFLAQDHGPVFKLGVRANF